MYQTAGARKSVGMNERNVGMFYLCCRKNWKVLESLASDFLLSICPLKNIVKDSMCISGDKCPLCLISLFCKLQDSDLILKH